MKSVVLAEKPSVARDIARVLKCQKKGNGFLEGDRYIVTWALGHLVTLADPEMYDKKYKEWRLDQLPMLPQPMKLVTIRQTTKQFNAVKAQLVRKDVNNIIIATDAGREGELVARWILEKANIKKPLQRLWISSVTDKAIRDGFGNLQSGKKYDNLYAAAVARSSADWLIGMNATRALTTKFNAQLSCGRVQTPTLAMIAQREAEIRGFVPKEFYGIKAQVNQVGFTWHDSKSNEIRSFSKEKIENLVKQLEGQLLQITNVNKKMKKSYAPALYDLTELQRDAHKRYNYSAKETLSIMQQLYEAHKVVTYPRTDSRYLTTDIVATLRDRIVACSNMYPEGRKVIKTIVANKSFVDNSKVSDHHAIIPTEQRPQPHKLSDKERRIYDLIVTRFLAVLAPAHEYEQTTIEAKVGTEKFVAKGKRVLVSGWKEFYQHSSEDENDEAQQLPVMEKGMKFPVAITMTKGETKPPEPLNEASLLSAMENPSQFVKDRDHVQTLKQTGGLGTVATRADIIEKLFNTFLIEKRGKGIHVTSKGKQLLDLAPDELCTPILTAEWEQKLEQIAKGKLVKDKFLTEIVGHTKGIVTSIKNSEKKFKHDNITGTPCPDCGKPLLEVNGKKGKMRVCQDRECGYRKSISRETNARCPNCHKKLSMVGEGEGQLFVCKCGHREKLTAFQKRRGAAEKGKASKQDVAKYLKSQQKAEPETNAFADAFAKLKGEFD